MLENTMMAVDKIQYCSEQVKRVQHTLFVVKIVGSCFSHVAHISLNVVCFVIVVIVVLLTIYVKHFNLPECEHTG